MKQYTIKNLKKEFNTDDKCVEFIFNTKYPNLTHCLRCGVITKHYLIKGTKRYATKCGHFLFPCKGTIFEKSSTPLTLWFHAIFLFSISKNGVSGKELERSLGITYKTAWRMTHKIRELMDDGNIMFKGTNEVDETYIGGRETNKHNSVRDTDTSHFKQKASIMGLKNRESCKVKLELVEAVNDKTISGFLGINIAKDSIIISDELRGYKRVLKNADDWFTHKVVNHSNKEYVRYEDIKVSTNGIEGMWSCLKRGLKETYIKVSKKYLPYYLNEFEFRQNHKDDVIFKKIIKRI